MNYSLDGKNARIFSKALQSLSRIGCDLFLETNENELVLKAVNSTKSAVEIFKFSKLFFNSFESSCLNGEDRLFCKVSMKACLIVFKNMKQVESCHIKLESLKSRLLFKLKCHLRTVKIVLVRILDDQNITEIPLVDDMMNLIIGSHKTFTEITSNFQMLEEEITIEAWKGFLNIKNYIEGSRVNDKFMRSQMKLTSNEFQKYQILEETSLTFCLKEFRAFLNFAESLNEDLIVNFQKPGCPIVFQLKKLNLIECSLTMSTLSLEDISFYENCKLSEEVSISIARTQRKRKFMDMGKLNDKQPKTYNGSKLIRENKVPYNFSELSESVEDKRGATQYVSDSVWGISKKTNIAEISTLPNTSQLMDSYEKDVTTDRPNNEVEVTFVDTENFNNRSKRKELRSVFSRCFEITYVPLEPSPSSQTYAPDSDIES